jgi:hypothetical protein
MATVKARSTKRRLWRRPNARKGGGGCRYHQSHCISTRADGLSVVLRGPVSAGCAKSTDHITEHESRIKLIETSPLHPLSIAEYPINMCRVYEEIGLLYHSHDKQTHRKV